MRNILRSNFWHKRHRDASRGSIHRGPTRRRRGWFEGSKGVVNAVSALRSRIKVLESSAASASAADCSPGLNKKRERERDGDRAERRNKQKSGGAWVKITARTLLRSAVSQRKTAARTRFARRIPISKCFAFGLFRDLITKKKRKKHAKFPAHPSPAR